MGDYRCYKFRIREEEMSKGYLEILDALINAMDNIGLLDNFIDEEEFVDDYHI